MQTFVINLELRPVSVTTTASVCKPLVRATWALLFWPTWPAEAVCKPTTFVVTEMGFRHSKDRPTISKWLRNKRLIIIMKLIFCKSKPGVNYAKICQKKSEMVPKYTGCNVHAQRTTVYFKETFHKNTLFFNIQKKILINIINSMPKIQPNSLSIYTSFIK